MKETLRRILSKTMAAFMALSMIAVALVNIGGVEIYAEPSTIVWTDWNLWIGDSASFTTSNEQPTVVISVPGATSGTATFTAGGTKSGTLVLNNFHYEGIGHTDPRNPGSFSNCPISAGLFWAQPDGVLTIELIGENVITQTGKGTEDSAEMICGIFSGNTNASIKITGEGSLTVTGGNDEERESYGIKLWGTSLTIEGGTITATGGESNVKSDGYDGWGLTQTGGVFNVNGGNSKNSYSHGVNSVNYPVVITGGKLNATGKTGARSFGIESYQGVQLSGDAECTAIGGDAEQFSLGIDSNYVTVTETASLKCGAGKVVTGRSIGIDAYDDEGLSIGADVKSVISSGNDCAVTAGYYPSNSNYNPGKIKNAIAGTGWTDADGTEGRTEIAVNTTGAALDFKKVQFPTAPADKTKQTLVFNEDSMSLKVGEKGKNELTGNKTTVTYKSGNTSIATVDSVTGEVMGVAKGETVITATAPEDSTYKKGEASFTVTVNEKDAPAHSHAENLTHHEAKEATETEDGNIEYWECTYEGCGKLFLDDKAENETTLEYVRIPKTSHKHSLKHHERVEATEEANGNIEYWECTDEGCKKIFSDEAGTVEITKEDAVIPKKNPVANPLTLSKTEATLTVGETLQLKATYNGEDATESVTWSSEDTSVATVTTGEGGGLVTAMAPGTVKVTAKADVTAECVITVKEKPAQTEEPKITPSENKAMDVKAETVEGGYEVTYPHQIPFQGKGKLTVESFGDNFTASQGNATYKVKKIKVNKKKHRIQILKLENAPKDVEKAVKKATKGDKGIPYTQNPYYVKDTDKLTPKFKKSGSIASVKVKINNKDYKAKKTEYDYDEASKLITFKGENLAGSWAVK